MADKIQMLLRETLELIYEKKPEEGVPLWELFAEAGTCLRPTEHM